MEEKFTRKQLIDAVEAHIVLWDNSLESYKCRSATDKAWREVCALLYPDFEEMDVKEGASVVSGVMKKWKNIRDTWRKAQRKRLNSKNESNFNRSYVNEMDFLNKLLESPAASITGEKQTSAEAEKGTSKRATKVTAKSPSTRSSSTRTSFANILRTSIKDFNPPPKKKLKRDKPDTAAASPITAVAVASPVADTRAPTPDTKVSIPDTKLGQSVPVVDMDDSDVRHLSFFKGILPSLKRLDEEQILDFQAGVISLLQSARKNGPRK